MKETFFSGLCSDFENVLSVKTPTNETYIMNAQKKVPMYAWLSSIKQQEECLDK